MICLKTEVPSDCGLWKTAGDSTNVELVANCISISSLYHLNYWAGEKTTSHFQWKWIFSFMFCNPVAGTMHSNEMCRRANWFTRIPDCAILSCDEKQAPCDYDQSCMSCFCAHAVISSTLYSWISKNLIGHLQVEIGNNSNMYHS